MMRLLQINNVASLVGGTGACSWSVRHALPDFTHEAFFFSGGEISQEFRDAFACDVNQGTKIPQESLDKADVVIFHNTRSPVVNDIKTSALKVYYQHSTGSAARELQSKCDLVLACSKFLCREVGLPESACLYQPCPVPQLPESDHEKQPGYLRIGRLCTPQAHKWREADVMPLYRQLSGLRLEWEFVGCPPKIQEQLSNTFEHVYFTPASVHARSRLHAWDAMLYSGSTVESYGRTVCEVQRCGVYPIVDRTGGFVEQIGGADQGMLCSSPAEFRSALERLIEVGADRDGLRKAGDARGSLSVFRKNFLARCAAAMKG